MRRIVNAYVESGVAQRYVLPVGRSRGQAGFVFRFKRPAEIALCVISGRVQLHISPILRGHIIRLIEGSGETTC